jgi:heme A synthase
VAAVKLAPVLGSLVLFGVVIQIVLGFQISAGADDLIGAHLLIGVIGLVLVVALTALAFRGKSAPSYAKIIMIILILVVLAQVGLGFQLLSGTDALAISHEANAFVILILSLLMGAVTMKAAKKQIQTTT